MFKTFGFSIIETAKNGEEAVNKFQKFTKKPDIIVMDYHMPHKNGLEATQAILEIDKTAKIVMISGDPSIKQKALASGVICFKEKPFKISELYRQIHSLKKKNDISIEE